MKNKVQHFNPMRILSQALNLYSNLHQKNETKILIIREYDIHTLLHFKMTLVHSLYLYASLGKRPFFTGDLPFQSNICLCLGEGNGTPLQCSCLENPMDGGAWQAAVHGVTESRTRLSYFTFTFHFHGLEKEMATHSSVLAQRIPGTEEPSELPSMGSHRVRHD